MIRIVCLKTVVTSGKMHGEKIGVKKFREVVQN